MLRTLVKPILALALVCATQPLWARSYHVADFNSVVHVDKNGAALVTEKISFTFEGQFKGVYRDILIDYPGPRGTNYALVIRIAKITDDSGASLKYEQTKKDGFLHLKIYVPGASDATRTINIDYEVLNATKFFEDHDEFYWNATGNDWAVPIESATTTVFFPPETSGSLRVQAYKGVYGSSEVARSSVEGPSASAEASQLPMRGGLTIDVYIPKDLLQEPSGLTKAGWFVRGNPIVWLPVWAFAVMFSLWWVKGRDPDPGMSVAPMYEPPQGMGPAEVGTLIDDVVNPRDITCVLVDLAVRGYIKIVETDHKGLLLNSKDYELHLLKDSSAWGDLTDYERAMMDQIFAGGQMAHISEMRNHFYTALPMIKNEIVGALKQKGMYTVDPDSAHVYWFFGAVAVILPFAALQWSGRVNFLNSPGLAIVCGLGAAAFVFFLGRLLTATSLKGAQTRVAIKGFQEFMNRVDTDRLKRMPPDTFEKFLPYAMALGVEHRWAKAFQGIVQNPPAWYQSSTGMGPAFNSYYFVNSVGAMTQTAGSAFVAAPRASSSSSGWSGGGGGGGGFSGGGFGGGGGGAF